SERLMPLPTNVGETLGTGAVGNPLTKRSYRGSKAVGTWSTMTPAGAVEVAATIIRDAARNGDKTARSARAGAIIADMNAPRMWSHDCLEPRRGPLVAAGDSHPGVEHA